MGKTDEMLVFDWWKKKWISNKSTLFEKNFFTILGLPFHHLTINISTSPSLSEEKISSNILEFKRNNLLLIVFKILKKYKSFVEQS